MSRGRSLLGPALLAATVLTGATACGSDEGSRASTAPSAGSGGSAESDELVSDAQVTAGLAHTVATLTSLAGSPSTATEDAITELFEGWASYGGTIEAYDADAHLALADALELFRRAAAAGDQAGMQSALTGFSTAASEYLTAHPG